MEIPLGGDFCFGRYNNLIFIDAASIIVANDKKKRSSCSEFFLQ